MRQIYFKMPRGHAIPLFSQANVLPISFIHFRLLCKLMWDISHAMAPKGICSNFRMVSDIHGYKTRSVSKCNFYTEPSSTQLLLKSCQRLGPNVWNSIPLSLKRLPKNTFNKVITNKLFQLLTMIDNYVEVSEISSALMKVN